MPTATAERAFDVPETVVIDPQTPDRFISEGYYRELAQVPLTSLFHFSSATSHFGEQSSGAEQMPFSD